MWGVFKSVDYLDERLTLIPMLKRSVEACSYTFAQNLRLFNIQQMVFNPRHLFRELFPVLEDLIDCHVANYSSLVTFQGRSEQKGR